MKIPLAYPKIPDGRNCPLNKCIAFEKYDGTNLHWSWDKLLGFHSFGTRRDSFTFDAQGIIDFNLAHPGLECASIYFQAVLENILVDVLKNSKIYTEAIIYTEFFGPNSFAGTHSIEDAKTSKQKLIIIDVSLNKKIISPQQLIYDFEEYAYLEIAKTIYCGKYTGQFVEDVRKGKYPVNEGVVVKGVVDGQVYMTKIKTDAYMKRLKTEFKDNWKNYWE
jgi:hypothetical protein